MSVHISNSDANLALVETSAIGVFPTITTSPPLDVGLALASKLEVKTTTQPVKQTPEFAGAKLTPKDKIVTGQRF